MHLKVHFRYSSLEGCSFYLCGLNMHNRYSGSADCFFCLHTQLFAGLILALSFWPLPCFHHPWGYSSSADCHCWFGRSQCPWWVHQSGRLPHLPLHTVYCWVNVSLVHLIHSFVLHGLRSWQVQQFAWLPLYFYTWRGMYLFVETYRDKF